MAVIYGMPTSPMIQRKRPDRHFVPKNFEEMYQHYYVYVLKLVVSQGIDYQSADDVAQTLFMKMDELGLVDQFDAEKTFNGRKALFASFIGGFVLKYVRHYRHRQTITQEREPNLVDKLVGNNGKHTATSQQGTRWIDVHGPVFEEEYTEVNDDDFRRSIRKHLASAPKGRKDSQLDLVALFNEVDRQVTEDGKYSTTLLMEKFSVTRTTIHNWLERLRIEVEAARTQ